MLHGLRHVVEKAEKHSPFENVRTVENATESSIEMNNALNEKWFVSDLMDNGGCNIVSESNVIIVGTNTRATSAIIEKIVADHNRLIVLEDAARKASKCLPHWTKERGRIAKHLLDVALKGESNAQSGADLSGRKTAVSESVQTKNEAVGTARS